MQEGDTELGGLQIPHGNNINPPTPTPGPQPVASAAPQNPQPVATAVQPANFESLQNTQNIQSAPSAPIRNNDLGIGRSLTSQPQFTPRQPQTQFSNQLDFVSSGTGDIALDGNSPKKNKKGAILIVILVIVILFGILIMFIVGNTTGVNEKNGERNFNIFANYILYGRTDDSQNLETESANPYALKGLAFYENDKAKEFYPLAMDYWNAFNNTYPKQDENITSKMTEINSELSFLDKVTNTELISGTKALEIYYRGGEDELTNEYAKYYSDFRQDSDVFRDFMIIQDTYISNIIQLLKLYNQEGCIVDAKEDLKCIEEKQLTNNEYYAGVIDVNRKTAQYISNIENELINDVIELNSLITKRDEYENQ